MDVDKNHAEFGIPGQASCPSWCTRSHAGSHAGPRREARQVGPAVAR